MKLGVHLVNFTLQVLNPAVVPAQQRVVLT